MKACLHRLVSLFATALILSRNVHAQQRPTLDISPPEPSGTLPFAVHGDAGTNYTVDASVDLVTWWRLSSAIATNGTAQFHFAPGTQTHRYFRARVDAPLPRLNLRLAQESFPRALTLITPEAGGTMSFTNTAGVIYRLTIPTNAVVEPQVFTMNLVTNLANLPFAAGLLGAATLGPDATELLIPARFELIFPTNSTLDLTSAAGYAFGADGQDLRLAPALPASNQVTIFLSTLSGVGASLATLDELQLQARRHLTPAGAPNSGANPFRADIHAANLHAASEVQARLPFLIKCHPEFDAPAEEALHALRDAFLPFTEFMAEQQAVVERKFGSAAVRRGDVLWAGNTSAAYDDFFDTNIRAYIAESLNNCALNNVLNLQVQIIANYAQSVWGNNSVKLSANLSELCQGAANCLPVIKACCASNPSDPQGVAHDIGVVQGNATTLGCPLNSSDVAAVQHACAPPWQGTMSYTETQHLETNTIGPTFVDSHSLDYNVTISFQPLDLKASTLAGDLHKLEGTVVGLIAGTYRRVDHHEDLTCCGDGCYTDRDEQSAIGRRFIAALGLIWSSVPGDQCNACSFSIATDQNNVLTNVSTIDNLNVISKKSGDDCLKTTDDRPRSDVQGFGFTLNTVPLIANATIEQLLLGGAFNSIQVSQTGTDSSVTGGFTLGQNLDDGTVITRSASWNFSAKP